MTAKVLLRIASILMLLHTAGHTMGALTWDQAPNGKVAAVVAGMKAEHFDFGGRSVSLAGFFSGYGFSMIGVLLLVSFVLWSLAAEPNRRFILLFGLFLMFFGSCELIWFFPFAAAFSLLAGLFTLIAYGKSNLR